MAYDVFVGWGEESVLNTPVARTQFARPYEDVKATHNIPRAAVAYLGDRDPSQVFDGVESGTVVLPIPLVYDGCGKLLKHCFGVVADGSGPPYAHTFTVDDKPYTRAASPLIGLTVEVHQDLPDSVLGSFLLYGGRVRSWSLPIKVNEEVKLSAELVGQRVIQAAKTASPTYPDYDNDRVLANQVTIDFDGGGAQEIYGIDITCNNSLRDDKAVLGSQYIVGPRATGKRQITGTIEKEWLSKALYDKFLSGASASIVVTCNGPSTDEITIRLNDIRYTGETPGVTEGEDNDHSLPFMAMKDATYTAIQIVNTNGTATT